MRLDTRLHANTHTHTDTATYIHEGASTLGQSCCAQSNAIVIQILQYIIAVVVVALPFSLKIRYSFP